MTSLTRKQREYIVLLSLLAVGAVVVLWRDIGSQREALKEKQRLLVDAEHTITVGLRQSTLTNKVRANFEAASAFIREAEARMPVGDVYRWVIKNLVELPASDHVELAHFEPPEIGPSAILPRLPYKAASLTVNGSGYYHEFGAFIAALENTFPHVRIRRLELEVRNSAATDRDMDPGDEKLSFRLELLCLARTSSTAP